ncbi:MAG: hypothetical protein LUP96_06930 [Methylococcaceae bacterium]|nr:hypothetical protein [Methylococcaceae bacterium]
MDTKLALLLALFFLLFFVAVIFGLYVWWKKTVFTREKFAFAGLAAASTLTLFVIFSIYAQEPPWLAFIGLIKQFWGLPYQTPQPPTIEQEILSLLVVAALFWLIIHLHRNWSGAQSTNQYEQQQKRQTPSLIADTLLILSRNQKLLAIYNPANQFRLTALEGARDSLTWHEQARDLLQLSKRNTCYNFQDDAWPDQAHCWIGTHKGAGHTVALACYENQPTEIELHALFNYVGKVRQHKQHDSADIEFIIALKDGDRDEPNQLNGHSIRTVSESRLLDDLVDFTDYFRDLRKRVEQDNLLGSELTLEQVYSESSFKLGKEEDAQENLEAFLDTWLAETSQRQIALLGEYGQGKSTNSLMLSYHLMQRIQQTPHSARIPILLELRGKSPRTLREDELLSTWAGRYSIDTHALMKLLVAGRLLLIFEGFDEVDLSGDADARIEHFKIMWGLCYPKAKIMVTGRPNYFLDNAELKAALGIQDASVERPYCQAIYLAPFNNKEIAHSLRHVDSNIRDGILDLAAVNERFYDIVSRPSMLHVVSVLWLTKNLAQYGERINSAVVMDLFIRHSLERQSGKAQKYDFTPPTGGNAKPAFMALSSPERAYFMEGIACYMLINQFPNQITVRQLEEVVRLLIDSIPEAVSSQTDAQSGESRNPLRQRYDFANKPEDIQSILTDVRACGLLVSDLSRSGSFKFGHKSFMEFLAGKVFAQWSLRKELPEAEEKSVCSLVNTLAFKMRHAVSKQEVTAFAVEWIAEKAKDHNDASKLIFALIFKAHSIVKKLWVWILRLCLPIMSHIKMVDITNISARQITFCFLLVLMLVLIWILPLFNLKPISYMTAIFCGTIFRRAFDVCIKGKSNVGFFEITVFSWLIFSSQKSEIPQIQIALLLMSMLVITLLTATIFGLLRGYCRDEHMSTWMNFRIWYAICTAAPLERTAIKNIIGEKALCLLEEVADKEPHPWTIAESLERLEHRD